MYDSRAVSFEQVRPPVLKRVKQRIAGIRCAPRTQEIALVARAGNSAEELKIGERHENCSETREVKPRALSRNLSTW